MAKKAVLEIKGFEEFYEKLKQMEVDADKVAAQKFEECMDILETEMRKKATAADLSPRLIGKITRQTWGTNLKNTGEWMGAVGWKTTKVKNPLSDFYKVVFYNYGTPTRHAHNDKQRININGKWVTLGTSRSAVKKHGFIKKAKLAASRKTSTLMKKTLKEMLKK